MILSRSRLFLMIAAFCVGLALFKIKYKVMALEKSYRATVKAVAENKEAIHVLKAELTHLNDPARLQKLAIEHLGFAAVNPSHIINFSEIPKAMSRVVSLDKIDNTNNKRENANDDIEKLINSFDKVGHN